MREMALTPLMDVGEPATLFESPGDYLHVFSLDSAPGIQLMEALFTAKVRFLSVEFDDTGD